MSGLDALTGTGTPAALEVELAASPAELLVRQRTATINAIRGLLGEFGLVAAKGTARHDEGGGAERW